MPEYEKAFNDFAAHLNSHNTSFHNAVHMINNAEQVAARKFDCDLEDKKASIEALTEQVKLKETESFAEKIASLNKELQDHKHLVELKEIELKNCTDNFQSLKSEHDKTLKGLDDVRNELNTCKQEIVHLGSQLQAKTATLESVNTQLKLERGRSEELERKYFALAESSNRKAE